MFGCRRVFFYEVNLHRAACAIALTLAIGGCASVGAPLAPAMSQVQSGASVSEYRQTIELAGRISVRYQKDGKEEALHGSFTWSQTPGHTLVTLLSPLGQTLATIDVTPDISSLIQAGQEPRSATDVDTLAAQALGWPLPVSGLRGWLQGFASDDAGRPFIARSQAATNAVTTPDGWRIQYLGWDDESHPKRIDLERLTAQAGAVAIRIIIDSRQAH